MIEFFSVAPKRKVHSFDYETVESRIHTPHRVLEGLVSTAKSYLVGHFLVIGQMPWLDQGTKPVHKNSAQRLRSNLLDRYRDASR